MDQFDWKIWRRNHKSPISCVASSGDLYIMMETYFLKPSPYTQRSLVRGGQQCLVDGDRICTGGESGKSRTVFTGAAQSGAVGGDTMKRLESYSGCDCAGKYIACAMTNGLYGNSDRNASGRTAFTTGVIAMLLNGGGERKLLLLDNGSDVNTADYYGGADSESKCKLCIS